MNKQTTTTEIITTSINNELCMKWAAFVDTGSSRTKDTYRKAIMQFVNYVAANNIKQPTRADIINYRNMLAATYKPTTAQSYMAAVKLFFKWTANENLYPNIAVNILGIKLDNDHKKDYLTTSQVSQLLKAVNRTTATGKRDYAIATLMLTTGLRTISIINANAEDIMTRGNDRVLYYKGKGHTEKAKYVKIAPAVEEAINAYLATRKNLDGKQPLFASEANRNNGERLTTRSISRICKNMLLDAGLDSERLTAHSFRHTAATQNLLNGGTLEETSQLLDHKSINTTMIYAQALTRENNKSEYRLAEALLA